MKFECSLKIDFGTVVRKFLIDYLPIYRLHGFIRLVTLKDISCRHVCSYDVTRKTNYVCLKIRLGSAPCRVLCGKVMEKGSKDKTISCIFI